MPALSFSAEQEWRTSDDVRNTGGTTNSTQIWERALKGFTTTVATNQALPTASSRGLTWDGTNLWVVDPNLERLYSVSRSAANTIIAEIPCPVLAGTQASLTYGGGFLWLLDLSATGRPIYKINPSNGAVAATINDPVANSVPHGIAWDPSTGSLLTHDAGNHQTNRFSTAGVFIETLPISFEFDSDLVVGGDYIYGWTFEPSAALNRWHRTTYAHSVSNSTSLSGYPNDLAWDGTDLWTIDGATPEALRKLTLTEGIIPTPSDFGSMTSLSWTWEGRRSVTGDDPIAVSIRIMNGAQVLAAADAAGTRSVVTSALPLSAASDTTYGPTAFAYINPTATKAQWDDASVEIQMVATVSMANDGARLQVDYVGFSGNYAVAVDTTPPSTPTNFVLTDTGSAVNVSWTASTDNVTSQAALVYEVARTTVFGGDPSDWPDSQISNPGATSMTLARPTEPGTYYYRVAAVDAAGNYSDIWSSTQTLEIAAISEWVFSLTVTDDDGATHTVLVTVPIQEETVTLPWLGVGAVRPWVGSGVDTWRGVART